KLLLQAFGLLDGPAPELYRVALAVLDLLTALAPLLVRVEHSQWLDPSSAEVLAFVARRIEADPIVLLVSARPAAHDVLAAALRARRELQPLSDEDASALLTDLAPERRAAVLHAAAGNPLALVELRDAPDGEQPMTERLEQAFAGQLSQLPSATRDLVLLAALSGDGRLATILAAGDGDLEPAPAAGLLR